MIVKYGTHTHALNEVRVSVGQNTQYSPNRSPMYNTTRWEMEGELLAATPELLTTAINALVAAYAVPGQDAYLYQDNGTTQSAFALLNAGSIGGVRVLTPPSFPFESSVYVNYARFQIVLEADYVIPTASGLILEWNETVTITGGRPRFVMRPTLFGPPVRQPTNAQMPTVAVQAGSAVGFLDWPSPPNPLWPADLHEDQIQITKGAPQTIGSGLGQGQINYPISWQYVFESAQLLSANPTFRPL